MRRAEPPQRGPITNRVIAELEIEGFPVGDNSSPVDPYGWQGEPNGDSQTFIPYLGLTPLNAQPQRSQDMSNSQGDWVMPYTVWYGGLSRRQTEALADRVRGRLVGIERESVETTAGKWRIQQIRCTVIGGNQRVGSAFPDYYTQNDTYEVWISKEKS